jgi:hypothetical protein
VRDLRKSSIPASLASTCRLPLEQVEGLEPPSTDYETVVLPLNHTCVFCVSNYDLACSSRLSYPTNSREGGNRTRDLRLPTPARCPLRYLPIHLPIRERRSPRVDAEGLEPPKPKGIAFTARSRYLIWIDVQTTRRPRRPGYQRDRKESNPRQRGFGSRCSATELPSHTLMPEVVAGVEPAWTGLQPAASPLGHTTTVGHDGYDPSLPA